MKNNNNSVLQHLNEEQIDNLIRRYYAGEKVQLLIDEYDIKCSCNKLVYAFPPEIVEGNVCKYCDITMIKEREPRTSSNTNNVYCPQCLHQMQNELCYCSNCEAEKKKIIEKKIRMKRIIPLKDISLKNRVYLATLV